MAETVLRRIRLAKGISLTAMAHRLGILASRLSMIESGQRPVTPDLAQSIAEVLGVRQEDLFMPDSFTARETNGVERRCS